MPNILSLRPSHRIPPTNLTALSQEWCNKDSKIFLSDLISVFTNFSSVFTSCNNHYHLSSCCSVVIRHGPSYWYFSSTALSSMIYHYALSIIIYLFFSFRCISCFNISFFRFSTQHTHTHKHTCTHAHMHTHTCTHAHMVSTHMRTHPTRERVECLDVRTCIAPMCACVCACMCVCGCVLGCVDFTQTLRHTNFTTHTQNPT